jgi:hypothetical protein
MIPLCNIKGMFLQGLAEITKWPSTLLSLIIEYGDYHWQKVNAQLIHDLQDEALPTFDFAYLDEKRGNLFLNHRYSLFLYRYALLPSSTLRLKSSSPQEAILLSTNLSLRMYDLECVDVTSAGLMMFEETCLRLYNHKGAQIKEYQTSLRDHHSVKNIVPEYPTRLTSEGDPVYWGVHLIWRKYFVAPINDPLVNLIEVPGTIKSVAVSLTTIYGATPEELLLIDRSGLKRGCSFTPPSFPQGEIRLFLDDLFLYVYRRLIGTRKHVIEICSLETGACLFSLPVSGRLTFIHQQRLFAYQQPYLREYQLT